MSETGDRSAVLHSYSSAPWLPSGGRADVVRGTAPPAPMCLVRVLVVDAGRAFCVPRDGIGKLDIPTRLVGAHDPSGQSALGELIAEVVGSAGSARFIGAVRNTVAEAPADYPWPTPLAHFGVWRVDGMPVVDGVWLPLDDASPLADRHWFPLARAAGTRR